MHGPQAHASPSASRQDHQPDQRHPDLRQKHLHQWLPEPAKLLFSQAGTSSVPFCSFFHLTNPWKQEGTHQSLALPSSTV